MQNYVLDYSRLYRKNRWRIWILSKDLISASVEAPGLASLNSTPYPVSHEMKFRNSLNFFYFFFEVKLSNWKKESSGYVTEKQLSLDMLGMEM